jgi:hypothetical protein
MKGIYYRSSRDFVWHFSFKTFVIKKKTMIWQSIENIRHLILIFIFCIINSILIISYNRIFGNIIMRLLSVDGNLLASTIWNLWFPNCIVGSLIPICLPADQHLFKVTEVDVSNGGSSGRHKFQMVEAFKNKIKNKCEVHIIL